MTDRNDLPLGAPQEILNIDAWREQMASIQEIAMGVSGATRRLGELGVGGIGCRRDASVSAAITDLRGLRYLAERLAWECAGAIDDLDE